MWGLSETAGRRGKPFPRAQVPEAWWLGQGRGRRDDREHIGKRRVCLSATVGNASTSQVGVQEDESCIKQL